jgi:hypothetical protein
MSTAWLPEHGTAPGAQETETRQRGVTNLECDWIYKGGKYQKPKLQNLTHTTAENTGSCMYRGQLILPEYIVFLSTEVSAKEKGN